MCFRRSTSCAPPGACCTGLAAASIVPEGTAGALVVAAQTSVTTSGAARVVALEVVLAECCCGPEVVPQVAIKNRQEVAWERGKFKALAGRGCRHSRREAACLDSEAQRLTHVN